MTKDNQEKQRQEELRQEELRLAPLRIKIDEVDRQLIELLSRRAGLALEVGHVKQDFGSAVFRPERERQILEKIAQINPGPLKNDGLQAIWLEIMSACRAIEEQLTVAYLGPTGTFSEDATLQFFGHSIELMDCHSLDDVFRSVQAGRATYGVVPIENSSEGAISRTLDLLLDTNLIICGEISIPIEHALLSVSTDLSQVKQVLAHAQALAQCQEWLNVHAPHLQRQAVSSNAQAAKLASVDPELAAIASLGAAKHYGLQVVHAAIQDDVHNRTRFVVIGQHACAPSGHDQTSLILSVANEPGAVYQLLAPLAKYGVSMTRLESRPARRGTWEYHFYIDIEGHQSEVHIASALQELRSMAAFYKCVGSYPKSKI